MSNPKPVEGIAPARDGVRSYPDKWLFINWWRDHGTVELPTVEVARNAFDAGWAAKEQADGQ